MTGTAPPPHSSHSTGSSLPARPSADDLRQLLDAGGVAYAPGLEPDELRAVEEAYGIAFAPEHRLMLEAALPLGPGWPDWRDGGPAALRMQLGLPAEGVVFDVENAGFWPAAWGARPAQRKHALKSARWHLAKAPRLVPVHGNCYLPGIADAWGLPVLAVRRTEVEVRGASLADYLGRAFGAQDVAGLPVPAAAGAPEVEFWGGLVAD
ncbi:hypothetical protein [Yinghuangia soli]|uniref:SMI1/KNR4 family protein n=1 Tax=Yinghuangia soli TaxID=2908204 RepID=A0AA41PVM9_9ACTN|nr:hypothetical protein [Yinghuangia soli]MCF2525729.1 hypothetical protein [Yinghuangia soli]